LFCDNKSAITMTRNPIFHSKTKHIALKHHFFREEIKEREVDMDFCKSNDQVVDIFTKTLSNNKF